MKFNENIQRNIKASNYFENFRFTFIKIFFLCLLIKQKIISLLLSFELYSLEILFSSKSSLETF